MPKPLLVPLDGSAFAEQALPLALSLARTAGAELQLVRVRPSMASLAPEGVAEGYLERMAECIEPQLPGRIRWDVLVEDHGPMEYPPSQSSAVAEALARTAEERGAAQIVMATHGYGGVRRAWLGSVADLLIRIASCPVLLVRPVDSRFSMAANADRGIHHVLIPLDGTATAEQALPFALGLGAPFDARYTLLRVISPLAWGVVPNYYDPLAANPVPLSRAAAAESLTEVAHRMRLRGLHVDVRVQDGMSPGPAIVDFASSHDVDLIVIGTAGAARIRRLILGSVTDKVVRGASTPVLVCNVRRAAPEAVAADGATTGALVLHGSAP